MQKLSILILLFVISLFHPIKENKNFDSINHNSVINIDSLRSNIKSTGWDNSDIVSYRFHILNSDVDIKSEREELKKLPASSLKTFLYSIILKREQKFNEMFDSLYSIINKSPDYLYYYDELSFASTAANRQPLIHLFLGKNNSFNSEYRNYLLGLMNLANSNGKAALEYMSNALKMDTENSHILYQVSFAYRDLGEYPKALDALKKSLEKNNDKYLTAEILLAQGSIYYFSNETGKAEKLYNEALNVASGLNDQHIKSRAMVNLGIIKDIAGVSIEARSYFNKARDIAAGVNDLDNQALALSELGVSWSFTNNLIEAKSNYLKSYDLYKTLGIRGRLSFLSDNIAKLYMTMFDYNSALKIYQEGIQFAGDNKRAKILNLIGLADVYTNLSNYTKAIDYYKEAQDLSSQINELSLKADINKGLGILNYKLDNFKNALHYFNSFEELSASSGYTYMRADAYHKSGICFMQMDSTQKAFDYLQLAESTAKKSGDPYLDALCLTDLAAFYVKLNNNIKAMEYIIKAELITAKSGFNYLDARLELIAGDITDNFDKSKLHYESALALAKKLNDFDLQVELYTALAKLFEKNNLVEAADSYYSSAIGIVEHVSHPLFKSEDVQVAYFSSKRDVYTSYAEFLLKQKKYSDAFNLIDKSRSRNLLQNLTNLKLQSMIQDQQTLNRLYEYEWMIHSGIYSTWQLDSISLHYEIFKKDLISSDKNLTPYLAKQPVLSISQIQSKLNPGENILSIYSSSDNTFLFLINKNGFKPYETGVPKNEATKLLSSISPYYAREGNTTYYNQDLFAFNSTASYEFYNKILRSALNDIPKQDKIIIIPSFELIVLPFDFLVTGYNNESSSYSYSDKHFLIYDYDFSYAPSASAFIEEKTNRSSNNKRSLIIGDPFIDTHLNGYADRRGLLEDKMGAMRSIALLPLKYSKEEVSEIGNILSADMIFTDKNATETNFKQNAENNSIIHLSTHSFLFNKQPVIFFSNVDDKYNDGFLEASEIVQLKLNSDLVVLSSCNSGLGRLDESEGIMGMSKAFFEAGARSVVVSLWEVNDKYTSRLMTLFYKKLSDGFDKSEALRQAKIEFIKKYSPNPYYWGAFVLSGDISNMQIKFHLNIVKLLISILVLILSIVFILVWNYKYARKKLI